MTDAWLPLVAADRTQRIHYAVREVLLVADEAKARGRELLYLNIGDPMQFDFETPATVIEPIVRALRDQKTCYAPSMGLPDAIEAVRARAETQGIIGIRDVFLGSGASECIDVALAALANPGENVLVPWPGYPLYSAVLGKYGAVERPYFLDEDNGWAPDPEDIAKRIDRNTKAIVLINPNNPTGGLYPRETLEAILKVAERHQLVVMADEIYDRLILEGEHVSIASLTDQVPVLTFNGLSKAYLGPGLRVGWCVTSGPERVVRPLIEAMHKMLRARLCSSHPAQYAVAPALEGDQSHFAPVREKLLARRDLTATRLNAIEGISCVPPAAGFYAFPRLHLDVDDAVYVADLIRETGVVVVPGSGFGQKPGTAHFRVVFLPSEPILGRAFDLIERFVASNR